MVTAVSSKSPPNLNDLRAALERFRSSGDPTEFVRMITPIIMTALNGMIGGTAQSAVQPDPSNTNTTPGVSQSCCCGPTSGVQPASGTQQTDAAGNIIPTFDPAANGQTDAAGNPIPTFDPAANGQTDAAGNPVPGFDPAANGPTDAAGNTIPGLETLANQPPVNGQVSGTGSATATNDGFTVKDVVNDLKTLDAKRNANVKPSDEQYTAMAGALIHGANTYFQGAPGSKVTKWFSAEMYKESSFDKDLVTPNSKGTNVGLLQFAEGWHLDNYNTATGKNLTAENLKDPATNIDASMYMIAKGASDPGRSAQLAGVSFNGGPNASNLFNAAAKWNYNPDQLQDYMTSIDSILADIGGDSSYKNVSYAFPAPLPAPQAETVSQQ